MSKEAAPAQITQAHYQNRQRPWRLPALQVAGGAALSP